MKAAKSEAAEIFRLAAVVLALASFILVASCGGSGGGGDDQPQEQAGSSNESASAEETTSSSSGEQGLTPAEATVGPNEDSSMMPAGGKEPDPAQPPPQNPPEGVVTFPATTNRLLEGPIEFDRDPPTNGDHDPRWQNCGFYPQPIQNRYALHTLDHGAVWISYSPELSQEEINQLRPYGEERYVIVSPYPDLRAPVVVTAWRNQLDLDGVDDPRLRLFVDQFRVSETAPLSGNGCTGGVGEPES